MTIWSSELHFFVNGQAITLDNPAPELTLLRYLRSIGLTGTKLGCAEGGCGACTVLVSSFDPQTEQISHISVNACLMPLCAVDGKHVITIEGIGNVKNPHPAQERIAKAFGSQCGFCTPGIVMSLYALLRNHPKPTEHQVEEAFDGNLCRCTGYRPILDAAKSFSCPLGKQCCRNSEKPAVDSEEVNEDSIVTSAGILKFKKYDPSQDLIFPPALLNRLKQQPLKSLRFESSRVTWFRPINLTELLELKHTHPEAKIVGGNTEIGIETKFKNMKYSILIHCGEVRELLSVHKSHNGVEFGAGLTLSHFVKELKLVVETEKAFATHSMKAILENLKWFAGTQIRNVATIAGNIVTASPISDLNPVLVALNVKLKVQCRKNGTRWIPMDEFFLGYRKTALDAREVVLAIAVPYTRKNEFTFAFKQAKRRDDDIAIVTCGFRVLLKHVPAENKWYVEEFGAGFGGMGPTTSSVKKTCSHLCGEPWNPELIELVTSCLEHDLPLSASAPGGMVEYRRVLAASFFLKFYWMVSDEILGRAIPETTRSILTTKARPITKALQLGSEAVNAGVVGKTVTHVSALKQVTGTAMFLDDIPKQAAELYAGLVFSSKAHANILSVDPSAALAMAGVVDFISSKDIPGDNMIGPVFHDEELFASKTVHFHGQLIGIVLAETQLDAQEAAKMVKVEYEELPAIFTIEDAVIKESFFPITKSMVRGNVQSGFTESDHVIEGEIRIGSQNHFYLETQASLVMPKLEDDEFEIWSSTQNPTETQTLVAHVLGISKNKVVCKVKRLGGGFGGKETRSAPLTCALAVAANKLKRPVRCMLDRDEDMVFCGQRHSFLGKYKIGFTEDGLIKAADVQLFSNAGYSADLSIAIMERAVSHSDNVYFIPNIKVHGKVCKTNIHSNTAFRGFGGPQGMLVTETWISHIADALKMPVEAIRELNMYQKGQSTHFNQRLDHFHVPRLWNEIIASSDFKARSVSVDEFNSRNDFKKRGIALVPSKFGIAFTARFLNQAGALVHIYTDGSVLLSHGGTEMGQGLHTKMIQICADALKVPMSTVHISETSTDKVANTSPTAASASSDLNGMAVLLACEQINERLAPLRDKTPNASFSEIVAQAYRERINLSANGFYQTPELAYSWDTNSGRLFNYFTFGVAAAEVEVDILTGDFTVLRADVTMDLGRSINPGIDIGQIEGAFIQGMGWSTIEETLHLQNGALLTRGPGNYKIPSFGDIPLDFRVNVLEGCENSRAVHSSKAVGEPPLFLGSSVYFAIKNALKAARFDCPATSERIRMSYPDDLVKKAKMSVVRKEGEVDWCFRA